MVKNKLLLLGLVAAGCFFFGSAQFAGATPVSVVGFELGHTVEGSSNTGTFSIQSSTVRTGTYALQVNPVTTAVGRLSIAGYSAAGQSASLNLATSFIRFYFRYATKPSSGDEEILCVLSSICKLTLRLNSSGQLAAYDSGTSLMSTGSTVLSDGVWYLIEVETNTGASADWEVKIDGVSEISGTGDLHTSNATQFNLGKSTNRNGNTVDFFYDDVVVDDTAYPGPGQIVLLKPTSDHNNNWTAGTNGSDYQEIDEVPLDGDTTYIATDVDDTVGTFEMENSSVQSISGTINSLVNVGVARKTTLATGGFHLRLISGATTSDTSNATSIALKGHAPFRKIYTTDPDTSSAWTTSGIDALKSGGFYPASATAPVRLTSLYLMVDFTPASGPAAPQLMLVGEF